MADIQDLIKQTRGTISTAKQQVAALPSKPAPKTQAELRGITGRIPGKISRTAGIQRRLGRRAERRLIRERKAEAQKKVAAQERAFEQQVARAAPQQAKEQYLEPIYQKSKSKIDKRIKIAQDYIKKQERRIQREKEALKRAKERGRDLDPYKEDIDKYEGRIKEKEAFIKELKKGLRGSKADVVERFSSGQTIAAAEFAARKVEAKEARKEAQQQYLEQLKTTRPTAFKMYQEQLKTDPKLRQLDPKQVVLQQYTERFGDLAAKEIAEGKTGTFTKMLKSQLEETYGKEQAGKVLTTVQRDIKKQIAQAKIDAAKIDVVYDPASGGFQSRRKRDLKEVIAPPKTALTPFIPTVSKLKKDGPTYLERLGSVGEQTMARIRKEPSFLWRVAELGAGVGEAFSVGVSQPVGKFVGRVAPNVEVFKGDKNITITEPIFGTTLFEDGKQMAYKTREIKMAPLTITGEQVGVATTAGLELGKYAIPYVGSGIFVSEAAKELRVAYGTKELERIKLEDITIPRPEGVTDEDWKKYEKESKELVEQYNKDIQQYNKQLKKQRAVATAMGALAVIPVVGVLKKVPKKLIGPSSKLARLETKLGISGGIGQRLEKGARALSKETRIVVPKTKITKIDIVKPGKTGDVVTILKARRAPVLKIEQTPFRRLFKRPPKVTPITKPFTKVGTISGKIGDDIGVGVLTTQRAGAAQRQYSVLTTGFERITPKKFAKLPAEQQFIIKELTPFAVKPGTQLSRGMVTTKDIFKIGKTYKRVPTRGTVFDVWKTRIKLPKAGKTISRADVFAISEPVTKIRFGPVVKKIPEGKIYYDIIGLKPSTKAFPRATGKITRIEGPTFILPRTVAEETTLGGGSLMLGQKLTSAQKKQLSKLQFTAAKKLVPPKPKIPKSVFEAPKEALDTAITAPKMVGGLGLGTSQFYGVPTLDVDVEATSSSLKTDLFGKTAVTPRIKTGIIARPIVRPFTRTIARPALKPITQPITQPVIKPIVKPVIKPVLKSALKPVVKPTLRQVVRPIIKPTAEIPPPRIVPPKIPEIKISKVRRDSGQRLIPKRPKSRRRKTPQAFTVEIKRRGKFVPIAKRIPKATAFAIGAKRTAREAAATFRITPTAGPARRVPRVRVTPVERVLFRRGKQAGTFVQKKKLRIVTPGEVKQISYVGAQAAKGAVSPIKPRKQPVNILTGVPPKKKKKKSKKKKKKSKSSKSRRKKK
ncbi:MAG: hypothetical protein ACP5D2_02365 [Candidatus Nanoarchaeia archaeon]